MRKLLLGILLLNFATTEAKESLRAEEVITVTNGKVIETGILTDEKGTIFLEFLKGSFINYTKDKQPFSGDILPPSIIDKPEKFPRSRMREILSFELLTDNADEVALIDRYTLMHPKEYLRTSLENPDGLVHNGGIKFLTRIYDKDKVGLPSLWRLETKKAQYKEEEIQYWKKVGGKLNETAETGVKVFSTILNSTGVYGLFDEDPAPFYSENTPLEAVQTVEVSPFPSVVPQKIIPIEEEADVSSQMNEVSDDFDFNSSEEELVIPAVEVPQTTPVIPAIEDDSSYQNPTEEFNTLPPFENKMQASTFGAELLPVAGPEENEKTSSQFPIILILSFGLLGTSIYLAIKKEYT